MPRVASAAPRAAQPPGSDWKDSYFNLDVRYQQLRKLLNAKEEELKLLKVAQRKSKALLTSNTRKQMNSSGPENSRAPTTSSPEEPSKTEAIRNGRTETRIEEEDVLVPSVNFPKPSSTAFVADLDPILGPAAKLPDPAMIWGSESNANNYVIASALYHANEELQSKLNESSTMIQVLQRELSSSRSLCTNLQARIEDLAQQIHQLIRERDLATQKLSTSQQSVTNLQRTLQNHIGEEQKLRFSLENQIADLRSRVIVGADTNDHLTKDVRSLLSDSKAKDQQVMGLQSKLALAESALSSQRNTNENLLLELRGLNQQLVGERKRVLVAVRELELAQLSKDQIANLETQLRQLKEERANIEREHAKLLSEYANSTQEALRLARQEVQADLADSRRVAQHWECLSQLLYKDVVERTQNHQRCRAECEEAKAQRDTLSVKLRQANEELKLCHAKLAVVWPNHGADADGLSAEEVLDTFKTRAPSAMVRPGGEAGLATPFSPFPTAAAPQPRDQTTSWLEKELPIDRTTTADRIHELHEANALLVAEVEQLRLANEMHLARIEAITGRHDKEKQHMADAKKEMESREAAGRALLTRQLDRVQFLESQVRSLRGYHVSPSTTMESIPASETVLELFLGQLVAVGVPEGVPVPEDFSQVFCSVDFLLHETVTTPTVRGFNGFFDTTISFRIAMDALLLYYLQTRQLLVQLHRIRSDDEVSSMLNAHGAEEQRDRGGKGYEVDDPRSSIARSDHDGLKMVERLFETVAEGCVSLVELVTREESLHAARPSLKGHIKLLRSDTKHVASVEFFLTARTPFSESFKELVTGTLPTAGESAHLQTPAASNRQLSSPGATPSGSLPAMGHFTRLHDSITDDSSVLSRRGGEDRPIRPSHHGGLMQLILASTRTNATLTGSLLSSYYSSATAERSSISSTDRSYRPREQSAHNRGHEDEMIRLRPPRSSSVAGVKSNFSLPRAGSVVPGAEYSGEVGGFAHISRSFLTSSPSMDRQAPAPEHQIHAIAVDVVRVELPTDLSPPLPRLSCLYTVPGLTREVRLRAPARAQYTIEYPHPAGRPFGEVFAIDSLAQLARLAREPLTFFFADEDAGVNGGKGRGGEEEGGGGVWAMALCECAGAMGDPGRPWEVALPLWRTAGGGVRTALREGVVRVRITAFTEGGTAGLPPPPESPLKREEGRSDPPQPPGSPPATALTARDGDGSEGRVEAGAGGRTPSPGLQPPPTLTDLRGAWNLQSERQQVSAFPGPASSGVLRRGARGDAGVGGSPSLEEELMRLEYEKHINKG
ncbi:unnamed protein product [Phytomonas sp. EM1]|nr:unnamed protein product [Phytomonas sp. EM1]|eukprot:CCW65075.1 unnamed protein product [Phytomonas sp. isolate EM1]